MFIISPAYRRAALHLWKERLGSHATYEKLINIFESAGYRAYAEIVRNIACSIEGEMDDFVDCSELLPQPETYPPPRQSPPSSPKLSSRTLSSYDEYLLINPAAAKNLPKGESCIYYQLIQMVINFVTIR